MPARAGRPTPAMPPGTSCAAKPPSPLHVRWIAARQLTVQPWKNGGGQTRQIALWPPGATADNFVWRISAADVSSNGPFSVWPRIDRTLLLTQGGPLLLTHPESGVQTRLGIDTPPFRFAGETAYQAVLQGAKVRDFNLMLRRGHARGKVERHDGPFILQPARGHTLLHVIQGRFRLHGPDASGLPTTILNASDTLWLTDDAPPATAAHEGPREQAEQGDPHAWRRITLMANGLHVSPVGTAALIRVRIRDSVNCNG